MCANRWRDEAEFPLARAVEEDIFLRAEGRLDRHAPKAGEPPDHFDYDPAHPVPTRGGALLMPPEFRSGPYDQRAIEERPDVLVYTGGEFSRDVEVTGPVTVTLWACSSAPSTDFVARLCDVYPDGRSINLTDGILRVGGEPGRPAGLATDPEDPIGEVDRTPVGIDVAQAGDEVGRGRARAGPQGYRHRAGDLHVPRKLSAGVDEYVGALLDRALVVGAGPELGRHQERASPRRDRVGRVVVEMIGRLACLWCMAVEPPLRTKKDVLLDRPCQWKLRLVAPAIGAHQENVDRSLY